MRGPAPDGLVVLCGGGVSKASHDATSEPPADLAWDADPERVRAWYDEQRVALAPVMPNEAHEALARMQHRLGAHRCALVTWTTDGLLHKASAEDVVELHGSLFRLRCAADLDHPRVGAFGRQPRRARCPCGAPLRPDVRWPGEPPLGMDRVRRELDRADVFLSVGASGPLVAELLGVARRNGARTIEVNVEPSGEPFDHVLVEPAEVVIPRLVGGWLGEPG